VAASYKKKYELLKEQTRGEDYMDRARSFTSRMHDDADASTMYGSVRSAASGRPGSVASSASKLAEHAKTLVSSMNSNFNCAGSSPYHTHERHATPDNVHVQYAGDRSRQQQRTPPRSRTPTSRSYREFSRSPQRVDV
jgi:hypothetical protein